MVVSSDTVYLQPLLGYVTAQPAFFQTKSDCALIQLAERYITGGAAAAPSQQHPAAENTVQQVRGRIAWRPKYATGTKPVPWSTGTPKSRLSGGWRSTRLSSTSYNCWPPPQDCRETVR